MMERAKTIIEKRVVPPSPSKQENVTHKVDPWGGNETKNSTTNNEVKPIPAKPAPEPSKPVPAPEQAPTKPEPVPTKPSQPPVGPAKVNVRVQPTEQDQLIEEEMNAIRKGNNNDRKAPKKA